MCAPALCTYELQCSVSHCGMCFNLAAIDLINNLLQVKQRKRYTVAKSLAHVWLQVSDQCLVRLYHWSGASCCREFHSHDIDTSSCTSVIVSQLTYLPLVIHMHLLSLSSSFKDITVNLSEALYQWTVIQKLLVECSSIF